MADHLIVAAILTAWILLALAGSWALYWLYDWITNTLRRNRT